MVPSTTHPKPRKIWSFMVFAMCSLGINLNSIDKHNLHVHPGMHAHIHCIHMIANFDIDTGHVQCIICLLLIDN